MVPVPVWDPYMPDQLSPPDGSVFDNYPRTTTLQWSPVQDAQSYTVELDCLHCCVSGGWCSDVGETYRVVPDIREESYTFDWVGAQPGRWRVWATSADGTEHGASPWWQFEYTR